MITVPKLLITVAAFLSSWLALSQNQYDENLSPENIPHGLYYQRGPGANNTLNWDHPFGSKITVNAGAYRNFELLTTNYPDGELKLRQWFPGGNRMRNQKQWIYRQVKDPHTEIINIGPKGAKPVSKYYKAELEGIKKIKSN